MGSQDYIWFKQPKSPADMPLFKEYQRIKVTSEYLNVFKKIEPLVSVVITTYNAAEMLINHSLKSVLQQTYKNLQIIVVDDGCTDETEEEMAKIADSRILLVKKEHEIPPNHNWCWSGAIPINFGLDFCEGDYVAHLDDDDYWLPEKIEKLIEFNKKIKADILHHPFKIFYLHDRTLIIDSMHYGPGNLTTSMMFYHGWFKKMKMDMNPDFVEQGDWNKSRRMVSFGGKTARYPEILTLMSQIRYCKVGRNQVLPLPTSVDWKWSDHHKL